MHAQSWVFQEVLNTRLFKLSREQEPPFATASISEEALCSTTQSVVLSAVAMEGVCVHVYVYVCVCVCMHVLCVRMLWWP